MYFLHSKPPEKFLNLNKDIADIGIQGVPTQKGFVFRRGTHLGPHAIRAQSQMYVYPKMDCLYDPELKKYIFEGTTFIDFGDIRARNNNDLDSKIERASYENKQKCKLLVTIGGDHSITHPLIKSYLRTNGTSKTLQIVHLDAHADVQEKTEIDARPCGTVFRRIGDLEHVKKIVQVGIRGYQNSGSGIRAAISRGNSVISAASYSSPDQVVDLLNPNLPTYISIDADVLDPSVCPGVSAPEPGGFTFTQTQKLLTTIAATQALCGIDFVEYNPKYDPSQIGASALTRLLLDTLAVWDLKQKRL